MTSMLYAWSGLGDSSIKTCNHLRTVQQTWQNSVRGSANAVCSNSMEVNGEMTVAPVAEHSTRYGLQTSSGWQQHRCRTEGQLCPVQLYQQVCQREQGAKLNVEDTVPQF